MMLNDPALVQLVRADRAAELRRQWQRQPRRGPAAVLSLRRFRRGRQLQLPTTGVNAAPATALPGGDLPQCDPTA